jgi:hypothetical protein
VVLPLQPAIDSGIINRFTVTFSGLEITGNGANTVYNITTSVPGILDSGTTDINLPQSIVTTILAGLGAQSSTEYGYTIPCSLAQTGGVLNFRFGNADGPVIAVPIAQLINPVPGATPTVCRLGIDPADENGLVFGDTFLRSAYVVYNLAGNQVAIAQSNFGNADSNIEQITATDSIPGATSTAVDTAVSGGALSTLFVQTGTWDLGTAASNGASTSTSHPGAASGFSAPSASFVGTIFAGACVIVSMLGGSAFIFL